MFEANEIMLLYFQCHAFKTTSF